LRHQAAALKTANLDRLVVDSTVQPKAVAVRLMWVGVHV
jgi:hypothetical protein